MNFFIVKLNQKDSKSNHHHYQMGKYSDLLNQGESLKVTCDETFRKYDTEKKCTLKKSDVDKAFKEVVRCFITEGLDEKDLEAASKKHSGQFTFKKNDEVDPDEFFEYTKSMVSSM